MERQVFEALAAWFGATRFRVDSLGGGMVEEIAEIIGVQGRNNIGTRSMVGRWLHDRARRRIECVLGDGRRMRLVLLEQADDSIPGAFRLQLLGRAF